MSDNQQIHAPEADPEPKNALDRWVIKTGNALSLLFIFTVIISFYEVVMRYVFDSPTTWVHETASFLGGALFVIGGIYAFASDKHVRVVLIYDFVSPKVRNYLNLFHHIVGLAFSGMMAYAAYLMVQESWFAPWGEFRMETSGSVLNAPFPALLKGTMFITLCILTIQFVLHLIQEIQTIRKHK